MNIFLLGLIVPCFSFALQVWPRLINRYFGVDAWRFLIFANYVRRYKKFPKEIRGRYLVTGPFCYPPVIIKILSFFPKKFNEKYQFIFSPAFDFIHNYFIFLATLLVSRNLTAAIVAQIVAALIPVVVVETSYLNTRIISYLVFSLSFFSLIMFSTTYSPYFFLLALIFLFILFYTHRFALQAYLFGSLGLSLVERTPFYILFFLGTFGLVFLTGGKFYRLIFEEHMAHLIFWIKNIDFRYAHQFRGVVRPKEVTDFVYKVYNLSFKNPLVYILGNNPWLGVYLLAAVLPYATKSFPGIDLINPVFSKLNIWILVLVLTSFLTLFVKGLRFLGEGHRYLEYAVLPIAIELGNYFSDLYRQYGIIAFLLLAVIAVPVFSGITYLQWKTILHDRLRTISKELWEIIKILNKGDARNVRLAIFPNGLADAILYFIRGQVLTTDSVGERMKLGMWPVMKEPLEKIVKKYRLNYILFDQTYVRLDELRLKNKRMIININNYVLLKV